MEAWLVPAGACNIPSIVCTQSETMISLYKLLINDYAGLNVALAQAHPHNTQRLHLNLASGLT